MILGELVDVMPGTNLSRVKGGAYHTYALLFLQGVSSENIKLRKFQSDKWLKKVVEGETVDTIISSFDTQMSWNPAKELLNDNRFSEPGKLVTQHRGEWAYIQNGLSQLDENGLMVICMGQGPLYRMINEAVVRQYLVETENVIDTIIALPKNVGSTFRHQSCLVIFKKNRQQNDILFIDSSTFIENYINGSTTLNQLKQKVNDIINDRVNIEKISYVASLDEIDSNNFNLNIAKYIKNDELENIDGIKEVQIEDIRDEIAQLENQIDNKMRLLNRIIN
ncbi:N-6 DNA methylase [Macrococcus epidermidis]|nr:N-6 DNA methylase [Macrococcus epidermidis]